MQLSSKTSKTNTDENIEESVTYTLCLNNEEEFCDKNGNIIDIVKTIEIQDHITLSAHDGILKVVPTPQNTDNDPNIVLFEKQNDGNYNMKTEDETKPVDNLKKAMANMAKRGQIKEHEALIELHTNKRDSIIRLRNK